MNRAVAVVGVLGLAWVLAPGVSAQWPRYPVPGVPRDAAGEPILDAPAPRTPDGKPDLSGNWMNFRSTATEGELPGGAGRPVNTAFFERNDTPPGLIGLFRDIGLGVEGGLPFQPWAAALRRERVASSSMYNPDAWCLPIGFMQYHTHPDPRKIVQTKDLLLIIYESNYGLRQIFLDGRPAPGPDAQPWWYGYSRGRWEGDTLVVETTNFRGDVWLDVGGSPMTQDATVTERFRRPSFGTLAIEVTVDDPGAYTRAWTVRITQRIMPDDELIEFICNENQQYGKRIQLQ